MGRKNLFEIVGKTEDGRLVVSGIYKFKESYGIPLDFIFEEIEKNNMIISWPHLIREAKECGCNMSKFMTELEYSVLDIYGKKQWEHIKKYYEALKIKNE